jgi:O-Antigen ligase
MNNLLKNLLLFLFPFFPIVAWAFHFVNDRPIRFYLDLVFIPLALYFLVNSGKRLPKYLFFFAVFVIYHIISSFVMKTIPQDQNKIFFIIADINVFALSLFVIIENTRFDDFFLIKMNRNILVIVIVSLIVSLIQIKNPSFFFNDAIDVSKFVGEDDIRIASIYSWITLNSGGITFPILIAILLNYYKTDRIPFFIIILCGIVVTFLTKARYAMISTIIAFLQLFFLRKMSYEKILSHVFVFVISGFFIVFVANEIGFNIQEVISTRILEKDSDMGSAKARITSYEVFLKKFPEHPWFGVGSETKEDVKQLLGDDIPLIHVGYLSYLYFYGIGGCLFLFGTFLFLLRDAWFVGKKYNFWGGFYGLLSFYIANTTLVYFNLSEVGVVLIVIYLRYYKTKFSSVNSNGKITVAEF